jgi:hypothetical protein
MGIIFHWNICRNVNNEIFVIHQIQYKTIFKGVISEKIEVKWYKYQQYNYNYNV